MDRGEGLVPVLGAETPDVLAKRWGVYETALRAAERPETDVQELLEWSLVQKQIYVADTSEQAEQEIRERLKLMAENQRRSFSLVSHIPDAGHLKSVVGVSPQDPDEFIRKALIIGDPESVTDQIRRYEAAGIRHLSLLFNYGFMTADVADRSLRLFLDEVLPRFRAHDASDAALASPMAASH